MIRFCLGVKREYSTALKMPSCDFVPKAYTGPKFDKLKTIRSQNISPSLYTIYKEPILLHQGYMQYLYDQNGRRYLDLIGGICTISVGHCHPEVTKKVNEQINTLWHTSNIYYHPSIHEYSEKLASKFPGNLKAMLPDPYQGLWGGSKCRDSISQTNRTCDCSTECKAGLNYYEQTEAIFNYSIPGGKVAAMFVEPIQGVGGVVQYPKNYIKKVKELLNKNGGLFVSDEVQTGFGRCGDHFWGFESHGIMPDIVTMAKGIGNGFPLAAVVTTPEIAAAHSKAVYFNTYGGNAVSSTVGLAVLEAIEEDKLQENSQVVGTYFLNKLKELQLKFSEIGDVRGKGLMIGVELVEPGTRKPIQIPHMLNIMELSKDMGVLLGRGGSHGNVLRIKPPMCVTKDDVNFGIQVLEQSLLQYLKPEKINKL